MLFTFLVSVIGNSLVIYVITKHRSMRTSTNCLIMNLAICDLLITVLLAPLFITQLYIGYTWFGGTLGNVTCKILSFVGSLLLFCSIFNLVVIALDRYLAVARPLKYKLSSKWVVKVGIPAMWLISALLSFKAAYDGDEKRPKCGSERSAQEVYSSLSCLVVSFIVLIVLYSIICYRLWRRNIPGEVSNNQQALAIRTARKVTVLMISVVIVFVVSWAPSFAFMLSDLILVRSSDISSIMHHPIVFFMSSWLILNSSACNPCLYFIFIESFRHSLKSACSCLRLLGPESRLCCIGLQRRFENAELMRNRHNLNSFVQEEGAVELRAYSSFNHNLAALTVSRGKWPRR
ncbi:tachykinin-like peptides receptor 86C [Orbicella faveolata]|uniref:tachykinin-like peptides receptor 86C n=1 Tax=Orbicella faveolata TaxID=48498 RepID=UPI0009E45ABA|nr:tachykinin-like peptides receptor 86C [Orbicella faveolata]